MNKKVSAFITVSYLMGILLLFFNVRVKGMDYKEKDEPIRSYHPILRPRPLIFTYDSQGFVRKKNDYRLTTPTLKKITPIRTQTLTFVPSLDFELTLPSVPEEQN